MKNGADEDFELLASFIQPAVPASNNDYKSLEEQERLYSERYKSDTEWRCRLSWWVIIVDSVWLLSVLAILACNKWWIGLSDSVLITVLGTTTLNVLGLAFIILKGLFGISPIDKKQHERTD